MKKLNADKTIEPYKHYPNGNQGIYYYNGTYGGIYYSCNGWNYWMKGWNIYFPPEQHREQYP